jgi:hypothetical protein
VCVVVWGGVGKCRVVSGVSVGVGWCRMALGGDGRCRVLWGLGSRI